MKQSGFLSCFISFVSEIKQNEYGKFSNYNSASLRLCVSYFPTNSRVLPSAIGREKQLKRFPFVSLVILAKLLKYK